jgi:hypothetical protein
VVRAKSWKSERPERLLEKHKEKRPRGKGQNNHEQRRKRAYSKRHDDDTLKDDLLALPKGKAPTRMLISNRRTSTTRAKQLLKIHKLPEALQRPCKHKYLSNNGSTSSRNNLKTLRNHHPHKPIYRRVPRRSDEDPILDTPNHRIRPLSPQNPAAPSPMRLNVGKHYLPTGKG